MKNDGKNTLKRALRTFFQTFAGLIAGGLSALLSNGSPITKAAILVLVATSVSGGISAVMNLPDHETKTDGVEESLCPVKQKRGIEDINELPMSGQDEPEATDEEATDEDVIRILMGEDGGYPGEGDGDE